MNIYQQEVAQKLKVRREIDPEQEVRQRVDFLKKYLADSGLRGYVLGVSGGQDSLLAGLLMQQAVSEMQGEGADVHSYALLLPYGEQSDFVDAREARDVIGPDAKRTINIKDTVDMMVHTLDLDKIMGFNFDNISDGNKGNIKAQIRMVTQYAIARANSLIVIGTDHAAEAVTGYYTKYGDGGVDVVPLYGLNKRQGRQILQYLGAPEKFYTKAPTAGLSETVPGRTDEDELGLSYDEIDDYLECKQVSREVESRLESLNRGTEHKREMPAAPEVKY